MARIRRDVYYLREVDNLYDRAVLDYICFNWIIKSNILQKYVIYLCEEGCNKSDIKTPKPSKKDTDAARLKRIYDIMGVDDAKKDAVYNSLIDLISCLFLVFKI